jgi:hypothetical protein
LLHEGIAAGAANDAVRIGTALFCNALHSTSADEDHAPTERRREPRGSSSGTASHGAVARSVPKASGETDLGRRRYSVWRADS